jgi:hypothetical protein
MSSMLHKLHQGELGTVRADGKCSNCGASGFTYPAFSNDNVRGYGCMTCGTVKPEYVAPKMKKFIEVQNRHWNLPRSEMSRRHKTAKVQLRFLPFLTPEFPENQGRIEVPLNTRSEAMEIFEMLREQNLIEDASLHYADGRTETLL